MTSLDGLGGGGGGSGDKATSSASSSSSAINFGAVNADGTLTPLGAVLGGVLALVTFGAVVVIIKLVSRKD